MRRKRVLALAFSLDLPRVRLAGRALGLELLGRFLDENERALGAGHPALHHHEVSFAVDSHDLVGACCGSLVAHLAGHAHALEDSCRVGGADGAGLADVHAAVAFGAAAEFVPLDEALETLALAGARDVDELAGFEDLGGEVLARLESLDAADLPDVAARVESGLLELAVHGCVALVLINRFEGDAHGGVAVLLFGPKPKHFARAGFEHGYGRGRPVGVEELSHAQLAREKSFHVVITI